MSSEHEKARSEAIEHAEPHGWTVARLTKRGYTIMRCSCGEHQETLKKIRALRTTFARRQPAWSLRAAPLYAEDMYVVGFEALLRAERELSAEDVTDLVEAIVDDLDRTCGDADVSTNGVGSRVARGHRARDRGARHLQQVVVLQQVVATRRRRVESIGGHAGGDGQPAHLPPGPASWMLSISPAASARS